MLKLAANRKGITGRLFSAGYKYFSKAWYNDLTSGLIYEQVARIVLPRQAALYTILAAHCYASAEQNWLSKVCLQRAPQFVGWARIKDYVDHKMARMAELDRPPELVAKSLLPVKLFEAKNAA
ncbi:hypothetical protein PTTG_05304 [Puccinia triticina 1-1 BBBD Race 1]|uniref:Uncharacterized protein n=2 Tax=Puccinia triticina TaxID=208348 RepID=A0A0C4EWV8_PUCT1|nr:uncharacterized protein PtA15_7A735 [Puccinia triticina]OAV96234.1 hypothetical protein PTTG_05304 [Puccinia triticina 1-1 BBBD Race 1]WAQ87006.1 hypothetical protein PtA15_7A735 [Puccinia triticina]